VKAIATIETSKLLEDDDTDDVKEFLTTRTINWDSSPTAPLNHNLAKSAKKLGTGACLSAGPLPDATPNVACSIAAALDPALRFFSYVNAHDGKKGDEGKGPLPNLGKRFHANEADAAGSSVDEMTVPDDSEPRSTGMMEGMKKLFSWRHQPGEEVGDADPRGQTLGVKDFDLLKVVGKGAFGKVMLVRKKSPPSAGQIFAMKVLKKSVVAAKGQVEHTKSERDILFEIRHPFVVFLRYVIHTHLHV